MLINASRLVGYSVLSLHVGGQIARVTEVIVDPNTLKVLACRVEGPLVGREVGDILPMTSVREFSRLGMIIDSADELIEADEVVQIRDVLKLNFELVGLKVETKKKHKLGKVKDFTVNPDGWEIQQLLVQRPPLKAFMDPELLIARSQIVEVDDYRVIVKDAVAKNKHLAEEDFIPNFINPFRKSELAPETHTETDD